MIILWLFCFLAMVVLCGATREKRNQLKRLIRRNQMEDAFKGISYLIASTGTETTITMLRVK